MELYSQFGHGMKQLTIDMAKMWGEVTVILSPRDMDPNQLKNWIPAFKKNKVEMLFDPQCYYPKCNHKNLTKYDYWDSSYCTNLESMENYEEGLIRKVLAYNEIAETEQFIIPSSMREYNDSWLNRWFSDSEKKIIA